MKWLARVIDEIAKVLIDIGKGMLLASSGAVLLGKVENYCILTGAIFTACFLMMLGLHLTNLSRIKEEKSK